MVISLWVAVNKNPTFCHPDIMYTLKAKLEIYTVKNKKNF